MTTKVWIPPAVGYTPTSTNAQQAAWIEDFRQSLIDIGLVQTGDSGQFTSGGYTTVAAGTNNTGALFDVDAILMYRFNDALQATAPIYIKIEILKTSGAVANGYTPGLQVTIGTGSDGVGNITGPTAQLRNGQGNANTASSSGAFQSWASHSIAKGFLGVFHGNGAYSTSNYTALSFFVERIPDVNGAPTGQGFTLWKNDIVSDNVGGQDYGGTGFSASNSAMNGITVMTPSGTTYTSGNTSIPYFRTMSLYPTDMFMVPAYHLTPVPVRSVGLAMIKKSIVTKGTEFDAVNYGVATSHYVAMDENSGTRPNAVNTEGVIAFLFE